MGWLIMGWLKNLHILQFFTEEHYQWGLYTCTAELGEQSVVFQVQFIH